MNITAMYYPYSLHYIEKKGVRGVWGGGRGEVYVA